MMCRKVTELMNDHLEGRLESSVAAGFRFHLALCPMCLGQESSLSGVTAITRRDAWAVGGFAVGKTIKTLTLHWNGRAWKVVPS